MAVTAGVAAVVTAGATIRSGKEQQAAANKQNRAQKRARALEKRSAEIQNQRERARLIAQQRIMQGRNLNNANAGGTLNSSATAGVGISNEADTSNAIAMQNTLLAANSAQSTILQKGADAAMNNMNRAANWQALGAVSGTVGQFAGPIK